MEDVFSRRQDLVTMIVDWLPYTVKLKWERARWMSCVIINPHLKRGISPGKITTFPWEKKKSTKNQLKYDLDRLKKESEFDDRVQEKLKKKNNA